MDEKLISIALGVVSGISATFVIWLLVFIFKNKFQPWFRKQVYNGLQINGDWSAIIYADKCGDVIENKDEAYSTCTYILNISNQEGHIFNGLFSQDFKCGDDHRFGQYKLSGTIQDGTLVISLLPSNPTKSTYGTLLLMVEEGGNCLKGIHTSKVADNIVNHCEIKLKKNN